jgi:hypothetical protein
VNVLGYIRNADDQKGTAVTEPTAEEPRFDPAEGEMSRTDAVVAEQAAADNEFTDSDSMSGGEGDQPAASEDYDSSLVEGEDDESLYGEDADDEDDDDESAEDEA